MSRFAVEIAGNTRVLRCTLDELCAALRARGLVLSGQTILRGELQVGRVRLSNPET
jgi:hypothetical protein